MAKRGDPSVLRLVVRFLRDYAQMTQAQFGKESRVAQPEVSKYELGQVPPSEETLRRMAKAVGIDWPLVAHLRQFYSALLGAAASGHSVPDANALDPALLEQAWLAVASYLIEAQPAEPVRRSPIDERRDAEQIWSVLEGHPFQFSRRLIELSPHSGSWALAVRVCEESMKRAAHKPGEALELAELALSIAERAPGDERWCSHLKGYCWAHVANARRVANDLTGADEAFARSWDCRRPGEGSDPELLAEWLPLAMEASLRRGQRRFSEALELLDRAEASIRVPTAPVLPILLEREHVFTQMGNLEAALKALKEAAPLAETSGDRRMLFAVRFNMSDNLCRLERYEEAAKLLPLVRDIAIQQANELDLIRVVWLTASVAGGQGRTTEALAGLEQVRGRFSELEMPYDAALAALDLALLGLRMGQTARVKELAVEMEAIFRAKKIDREALAALSLFWEAAKQEVATVELVMGVIGEVKKANRSAPQPFA